jgi:hypothetical protein
MALPVAGGSPALRIILLRRSGDKRNNPRILPLLSGDGTVTYSFVSRCSPSVLSPKYEVFCRRSVGCFSRHERSAHIRVIRVERATRKNSQLAPAQRVAMKMGRRPHCSSVTYRFRYAPSSANPARTALPAAHFDRNKIPRISGTGHQRLAKCEPLFNGNSRGASRNVCIDPVVLFISVLQ